MQAEAGKPITGLVNHIIDEVSTSLESGLRLFPGRGMEVGASVLGGVLRAACGLAVTVGLSREVFVALVDTYWSQEVHERGSSRKVGERR